KTFEPALMAELSAGLDELAAQAEGELLRQHVPAELIRVQRRLHLKYRGTDTSLEVAYGEPDQVRADFEAAYRQRYSFLMPGRDLVVETISVEATGGGEQATETPVARSRAEPLSARRR